MLRRTKPAAVLTLAMINIFTLAAGIAVALMLPPRLAALKVPTVAPGQVRGAGSVLDPGTGSGSLPTASGLRSALAGPCPRPRWARGCRRWWPTRPPGRCCCPGTGPRC